jgi:hypothetical protein
VGGADAATDAASIDAALDAPVRPDAFVPIDVGPPVDAGPRLDVGALPDFPAAWPRSRGWSWVRTNDPMISALSVRMGAPPADAVNEYVDDFGATAAHLWETGIPTAITGWTSARPLPWLSWVDADGNSRENGMLLGGPTRPAGVIGYQVGDEPRTREHFDQIMAGLARVATADPEPLRIFNFSFLAEEIDAYLAESCAGGNMDVIAYDHYSFGNGQFTDMMKFRQAALDCGVPYWRYLKGYESDVDRRDDIVLAETDMRWDAFSGLLAGYTGHTWFLYNVAGGEMEGIPTTFFAETENWAAARTPRFDMAARINRALLVYGRAQSRLRSTGVGWFTEAALAGEHPPDGFPLWSPGIGGDPFLSAVRTEGGAPFFQDVMFGFFEDRFGDPYVMVMNPNHEHGSFPTKGTEATEVTLTFDFATPGPFATSQLLVLTESGVVETVPIRGGEVTFEIAAGDLVFYKYDSRRGFEGHR